MKRALHVAPAGTWPAERAAERVTLAFDDRHRRRVRLTADGGTDVLLDLDRATVLNDGDGLALEDGGWIAVQAAEEEVFVVSAAAPGDLVRFAWHIGNRHCPAQLLADRIVIPADPVLADMLRGLGAAVVPARAPFTPEPGAYAAGGRQALHPRHGQHDHDDHDDHHGHHGSGHG